MDRPTHPPADGAGSGEGSEPVREVVGDWEIGTWNGLRV